jgi:hypothetical protein
MNFRIYIFLISDNMRDHSANRYTPTNTKIWTDCFGLFNSQLRPASRHKIFHIRGIILWVLCKLFISLKECFTLFQSVSYFCSSIIHPVDRWISAYLQNYFALIFFNSLQQTSKFNFDSFVLMFLFRRRKWFGSKANPSV